MLKSWISAFALLVAVSGSAFAAQTISQTTSVGAVGASLNNIGVSSGSVSGALGFGVANNINSVTQTADPTNVNLNSLHQLEQQGQGQGQLQF